MGRFIALLCAALVVGCGTPKPPEDACRLIAIATDEAQLAEAWYLKASAVLTRCGDEVGAAMATQQACAARRFNDSSVECKP